MLVPGAPVIKVKRRRVAFVDQSSVGDDGQMLLSHDQLNVAQADLAEGFWGISATGETTDQLRAPPAPQLTNASAAASVSAPSSAEAPSVVLGFGAFEVSDLALPSAPSGSSSTVQAAHANAESAGRRRRQATAKASPSKLQRKSDAGPEAPKTPAKAKPATSASGGRGRPKRNLTDVLCQLVAD